MNHLFRLKENVINFLSPPSKRRRTFPATPMKSDEHLYLTPPFDIDTKVHVALLADIKQTFSSSSGVKNPRKRAREEDSEDEDGRIELAGSNVGPDDSVSNIEVKEESNSEYSSEDAAAEDLEDEIEEDLNAELPTEQDTADEKVSEYLARQRELELRKGDIERKKAEGESHPDELFLFERLAMRSYEELLPMEWRVDFPTLPEELFTDDPDKQFIYNVGNSKNGGIRALQSLLSLGERVRANLITESSTERVMTRELNAYIKWTEKDAGYYDYHFLPVIVIVTAKPGKSNSQIGTAISNQMAFLAEKHREHLANPLTGEPDEVQTYRRQPPLLYGVIIAKTFAIMLTLDSANPDAREKHLQNLDFRDRGQGVWSGFALAFLAICARNYQLTIKDEFEPKNEEDPDL